MQLKDIASISATISNGFWDIIWISGSTCFSQIFSSTTSTANLFISTKKTKHTFFESPPANIENSYQSRALTASAAEHLQDGTWRTMTLDLNFRWLWKTSVQAHVIRFSLTKNVAGGRNRHQACKQVGGKRLSVLDVAKQRSWRQVSNYC